MPVQLSDEFSVIVVFFYLQIVKYLTVIFLIHFSVNLIYCLVANCKLKTDKNHFSVFLFSVVVLLNFRYKPGVVILDHIYFATIGVLFLPILIHAINSVQKYLSFIFLGVAINLIVDAEILIVMELIISFFIILFKTKDMVTGPASKRVLSFSYFMIVFFLSMSIFQYSVYQYHFTLNKSNLIVYFSYFYLIIVSLFYVFINTNFRRHFFV